MSENPFEAPKQPDNPYAKTAFTPVEQLRIDAQKQVSAPATALMIVAGIFVGLLILGLTVSIAMLAAGITAEVEQVGPVSPVNVTLIRACFSLLLIVLNGFICWAAFKMKSLENYGQAFTASILALIPCLGPCYLLGIPFGIWALVVLNKPEIKNAFRS